MNTVFKTMVTFVLVVIVLIIHPMMTNVDDSNVTIEEVAQSAVDQFTQSIQSQGFITPRDYLTLESRLSGLGLISLEFEYQKKRYQPVYTNEQDPTTFTGRYTVVFDGFYNKDILDVLFPDAGGNMDDPARRWNMLKGDLFYVTIQSGTTKNIFRTAMGFGQMPDLWYRAGGLVINEGP